VKLIDFKVLTFDCYGTLIDWESGIWSAMSPLLGKVGRRLTRDEVLGVFARHESAQQAETPEMPYSQLLAVVYKRIAAEWSVNVGNEEANIFGASVPDWPEFADSVAALRYLHKFYKLVILSNVDRISFRASNVRLGVAFDAIYSAQDVGAYKPSLQNFEYMLGRLRQDFNLQPKHVLHTAQSLYHDHAPAKRIGLASAWIDRRHADQGWGATLPPAGAPHYDFRYESMAAMVKAHERESS